MAKGFIGLGGRQYVPLFPCNHEDTKSRWGIYHTEDEIIPVSLSIPSRSKRAQVLPRGTIDIATLGLLDSLDGENYLCKLKAIPDQCWMVNYDGAGLASGIAIVNSDVVWVGMYDKTLDYSYLMWADDPSDVDTLLADDPLKFLIFRFPQMPTVFLPLRAAMTSKWHRWMRSGNLLLAFNALERRLIGHSDER